MKGTSCRATRPSSIIRLGFDNRTSSIRCNTRRSLSSMYITSLAVVTFVWSTRTVLARFGRNRCCVFASDAESRHPPTLEVWHSQTSGKANVSNDDSDSPSRSIHTSAPFSSSFARGGLIVISSSAGCGVICAFLLIQERGRSSLHPLGEVPHSPVTPNHPNRITFSRTPTRHPPSSPCLIAPPQPPVRQCR